MASILLEPGESFEHVHGDVSYTTLIFGHVEFSDNQQPRIMAVGEPIFVGAGCSHTIRNVGDATATVFCAHQSSPAIASSR